MVWCGHTFSQTPPPHIHTLPTRAGVKLWAFLAHPVRTGPGGCKNHDQGRAGQVEGMRRALCGAHRPGRFTLRNLQWSLQCAGLPTSWGLGIEGRVKRSPQGAGSLVGEVRQQAQVSSSMPYEICPLRVRWRSGIEREGYILFLLWGAYGKEKPRDRMDSEEIII